MKLNLGCKFSFFPPALIKTFPDDELPGREKINLWLKEQPLFVFNSCVCLLSPELGLQQRPGGCSGAAHTKDPLWLLALSFCQFFGVQFEA